jgi:hypothetical protein
MQSRIDGTLGFFTAVPKAVNLYHDKTRDVSANALEILDKKRKSMH